MALDKSSSVTGREDNPPSPMKTRILGLLAETSIHPGAGQSSGVVDLPVARDAATDYPVVPGSSLKGALLGLTRQSGKITKVEQQQIFGQQDNAGALLVSDARLLLLPVRSLQSSYKWITCPHLLERFTRDADRAGEKPGAFVCNVETGKYIGADNGDLFLEERQFFYSAAPTDDLVKAIGALIRHEPTRARLASQLVVLHDNDFTWFARHGLAVQARNVLDEEKKTSRNLWYEETIPPDALFYTLLAERRDGALDAVAALFEGHPYLQVGGNETVGMGWFAVTWQDKKGGAA